MKSIRQCRLRRGSPSARPAFVLVVVLLVIAMLALGGYAFSELMFTEHKAVRTQGNGLQARLLAESAVEMVKAYLAMPADAQIKFGGHDDNPQRFQGVMLNPPEAGEPPGRFTIIAPTRPGLENARLRYGLASESARLNLHAILNWEQEHPGAARNALLALPAMTEEIADAILDWIDADDTPREQGAEVEYYGKLQPPYAPPNAVPRALEELLWVRGVTRALLFGDDLNQNGAVEPGELDLAERRRAAQPSSGIFGWSAYLTLHSAEGHRAADGKPKINLNHNALRELYDQLAEAFDAPWARFVVAYRQYGPSPGPAAGAAQQSVELDFTLPPRFELKSVLDLIGVHVLVARSNGPPIVLTSPFESSPAAMRDYLPRLMDRTTTSSAAIVGRVNINEAPREVLLAVPGLGAGTVEDLLSKRPKEPGARDDAFRHPTWLLVEGLVDLEQMKSLLPYITTGGDVYRAQCAGYLPNGPIFRAEFIVDATGDLPRLVCWRELERLGRGYDVAVLGLRPSQDFLPEPPAY